MMKGEITMETLIKVIIGLVVLIVVVAGFYAGYSKLMGLGGGLQWNDLSLSEQQKVESNFNKMNDMLQSCSPKYNCLCGSTSGFPFAFRDEERIIVNSTTKGSANITLMHGDFKVNEFSLNKNVFLNAGEYGNHVITFKSGMYYVDGMKGMAERQAFVKTGDSFYIFNEKVDRSNAAFNASLKMKAC